VTPTRLIPTVTWTPRATSSPRPPPSLVPPTPTLSPFLKSLQIAYTAGGRIYLWRAGTVTIPVEDDFYLPCMPDNCNNVLFSDDSELIAYTTQVEDYELTVVKKDGSDRKVLIDFTQIPGTTFLYGMGWIPNTHLIWFNTIDSNTYHTYDLSNDLYIVNADTGELKEILPPGNGGDIYPSPDGKYLAIVRPARIEIRDADGRKILNRLDFEYTDPPRDYPPYLIETYPIPIWANDSSSLVVAILSPSGSNDNTVRANVWRLPVHTPTRQLISQKVVTADMHMKLPFSAQPLSKVEPRRYPVSISPDLNWLIYSHTNSNGAAELHLAPLDSKSDKVIHIGEPGYEYDVDWLPNSKEFFIIEREVDQWTGKGYFLGNIDGHVDPFPLNEPSIYRMDWLDDDYYLYLNLDFELRLGKRGEKESTLIERQFAFGDMYDFVK